MPTEQRIQPFRATVTTPGPALPGFGEGVYVHASREFEDRDEAHAWVEDEYQKAKASGLKRVRAEVRTLYRRHDGKLRRHISRQIP